MLQKLLDIFSPWSSNGKADPFDFSSLDFEEVDLDEMAEELSLEEKAISNGENEIPSSSATQLDGPQEETKAAIKGRIGKIMAGYEKRIKGLNNEIQSCRIEDKIDRLESAEQDLGQELNDLENRLGPKIEDVRDSVETAEEELNQYRNEHGIQREPKYPESGEFQVGVLVFVGVLEALVNGFFFRQGMEEGIVGGAFIALVLAAVDVLLVFWVSQYSVWAYYGLRPIHKTVGVLASAFAAGWILFYNLLTTHIREYLQTDLIMQEALQQALDRFQSSPFAIEQADSLVLFILGVSFSVSAYYAGAKWDETIPYYGKMHRDLEDRKEELGHWRRRYQKEAISLRDEKLDDVERILREAEDKTKRFGELIGVKNALLRNVRECVNLYRESFKALVKRYRDINKRYRSTEPPDYFDEEPEIEFTNIEDYSTEEEQEMLNYQKEKISKIRKNITEVKKSVEKKYREKSENY